MVVFLTVTEWPLNHTQYFLLLEYTNTLGDQVIDEVLHQIDTTHKLKPTNVNY